jgi:hypothetical protein
MPNFNTLRNARKPISTGLSATFTPSNHPLVCLKTQIFEHGQDGPTILAHTCRLGLEGIVSKRADLPTDRGAERTGSSPNASCGRSSSSWVTSHRPRRGVLSVRACARSCPRIDHPLAQRRTVVWEGRSREAPPYPDLLGFVRAMVDGLAGLGLLPPHTERLQNSIMAMKQ